MPSDNHSAFSSFSPLPQQQQHPETAKDTEASRNATWLSPPVMPVGNKPGGTAAGFMGKTAAGERWLLKLGMDKTPGYGPGAKR